MAPKSKGPPANFTHEELPDKAAIRIVALHPAASPTEPVNLDLLVLTENTPEDAPQRQYEALSWCWGDMQATQPVRIHAKRKPVQRFGVSKTLYPALQALRHENERRYLWIDAICINQINIDEKNDQVPRMDEIYGGAKSVCIWLGPPGDSSDVAFTFIREQVLELWHFDDLCQAQENAHKWDAVVKLMKRPWFSRRWIVQELALAKRATIYCGNEALEWDKFANAVALLVETEPAIRRLSEVIRHTRSFNNLRGYFANVQSLGAAQLVEITSHLFRRSPNGDLIRLSSLEALVSRLPICKTSEPRDIVYGLLAMARDSNPRKRNTVSAALDDRKLAVINPGMSISRSVQGRHPKSILARIYVLIRGGTTAKLHKDSIISGKHSSSSFWQMIKFVFTPGKSALSSAEKQELIENVGRRLRSPAQEPYEVNYKHPVLDVYRRFIAFSIRKSDPTRALDIICRPWAADITCRDEWKFLKRKNEAGNEVPESDLRSPSDLERRIPLPSWMPSVRGAPYKMAREHRRASSGVTSDNTSDTFFAHGMIRVNGDSLVGNPDSPFKSYAAAGTRSVDLKKLKFVKRMHEPETPWSPKNHYSMFVEGFVLDTVDVADGETSNDGGIPTSWLRTLDWNDDQKRLPPEHEDAFWRTLVADRGNKGSNPPLYYHLSCEKVLEKSADSRKIDTDWLINEGHCSIVADFLRRVKSTIFGRKLVKTDAGRIALLPSDTKKGDLVCILYGCSVPIILRRSFLQDAQAREDTEYDKLERQRKIDEVFNLVRSWQAKRRKAGKKMKRRKKPVWRIVEDIFLYARTVWFLGIAFYTFSQHKDHLSASLFLVIGFTSTLALLPYERSDFFYKIYRFWETIPQKASIEVLMQAILPVSVLLSFVLLHPAWRGLPWSNVVLLFVTTGLYPKIWPENIRSWSRRPPKLNIAEPPKEKNVYYELIGEAYVHGMMNGEAISWQNAKQIKAQMFELR